MKWRQFEKFVDKIPPLDNLHPPSYNPDQQNTKNKNADEDEYVSKRFSESLVELVKTRQKRRNRMDL
jgi:hypothetical protein